MKLEKNPFKKNIKITMYSISYIRLIMSLLYSLKIDKQDKLIFILDESKPNCLKLRKIKN